MKSFTYIRRNERVARNCSHAEQQNATKGIKAQKKLIANTTRDFVERKIFWRNTETVCRRIRSTNSFAAWNEKFVQPVISSYAWKMNCLPQFITYLKIRISRPLSLISGSLRKETKSPAHRLNRPDDGLNYLKKKKNYNFNRKRQNEIERKEKWIESIPTKYGELVCCHMVALWWKSLSLSLI